MVAGVVIDRKHAPETGFQTSIAMKRVAPGINPDWISVPALASLTREQLAAGLVSMKQRIGLVQEGRRTRPCFWLFGV